MPRAMLARIRSVWAAYSSNPNATLREICAVTGYTLNMVARHRRWLWTLGYLEFVPGQGRGVRVLVPLVDGRRVGGVVKVK